MSKTFKQAPRPKPVNEKDIDSFVNGGAGHDTTLSGTEQQKDASPIIKAKQKRLSVDLDEDLHRRFKVACAMSGLKMTMELMEFIELRTEELENQVSKSA